ncbi:AAA family ATPase [Aequorivita vladivostokensis]|uniref:ATPase AAA-type core domain-containing protein n=1 Tax=Aequorivita vladivostokensis TaxID=171194 RepID=A0ABR5DJU2_9FLAO|nr:AAA family ATPase [Aequorivita vladivostokensis]KJJ39053.1 hypothetical protein MB09_06415 [Aequorivita vladivostokensis]
MYKIISIQFYNHPVLGNHNISLADPGEESRSAYISLIIGGNGTGKTKTLIAISEILNYIDDFDPFSKSQLDFTFKIDILNNKTRSIFDNINSRLSLNDDAVLFGFEKQQFLPKRLIANAYTFNDDFPFSKKTDFYVYGGLRTASNNIFINKPIETIFKNLSKIINKENQVILLDRVFDELFLKKRITVFYAKRPNYNKLFKNKEILPLLVEITSNQNSNPNELQIEKFRMLLEKFISQNNKTKKFGDESILRFINDNNSVRDLLNLLINLFDKETIDGRSLTLDFKFEYNWTETKDDEQNAKFKEHFKHFKFLSDLDVASFDSFEVYRDVFYDFQKASSGEIHMLHIVSSIIANIEPNSVVIIDEPEISLHPNWQNKLIHTLKPIIEVFKDSHFIIASHSHFIVSDLDHKNSSITSLKRDVNNGDLIVKNLEMIDTEGWSAEQILFEIFEMPTDRNYYLSLKVQEILDEMSKTNPDHKKISDAQEELRKYNFDNLHRQDPFYKVLKTVIANDLEA